MSHDFFVNFPCEQREQVNQIIVGTGRYADIQDVSARIKLLAAALSSNVKDYARVGDRRRGGGYKNLLHNAQNKATVPYTSQLIIPELARLNILGLKKPKTDAIQSLPLFSFSLQFTFKLAKPYLSKDDEEFHICDNPVHKDKVFKVPTVTPSSWKGNLRWTAMKLLVDWWNNLSDVAKKSVSNQTEFAQRRVQLARLFGDEKGKEEKQVKGLAKYLDSFSAEAAAKYRQRIKQHFGLHCNDAMPNHSGRIRFCPTFFDRIDLEVINPHDRTTRAGTLPIYMEAVPIGAEGNLSLLYIPFDLIGKQEEIIKQEVADDLCKVAGAITAMLLTYGFSAKRTSGFGVVEDRISGVGQLGIRAPAGVSTKEFTFVSELIEKAKELSQEVTTNG